MRRWLVMAALVLAGCGGSGDRERVVVSAASSLKPAFIEYGATTDAAFSFAGSDELAAQIRRGVKPDVFAAANTRLPEQLRDEGLVEAPVVFATNALVIAVAPDADIASLEDLAAPNVKLALAAKDVPVGSYARQVLDRLPATTRDMILDNVRTEEPDVAGVVGKISQGAVDAGFVYATDVRGAGLEAVEIPASLRPTVEYGVAAVKGAEHPEAARAFVDGLTEGAGRRALQKAGFGIP